VAILAITWAKQAELVLKNIFFCSNWIRAGFGFYFAEKTLLKVCLTYIKPESNTSRIACFSLIPDPERIWIQNLKNRIGSGLKKFRG